MRLVNEKLAADLLEMGKKEFLLCGFQGANLRSIAASMGVTTGAIYRYYTDKAELFGALVESRPQSCWSATARYKSPFPNCLWNSSYPACRRYRIMGRSG